MTEIAIIGGGIGGLAAAAFLRRAGLRATVYEQAGRLGEVGAGVVVAPNAARLLRSLGVLSALAERAVPLEVGWEFRRWRDGRGLSAADVATRCARLYGERTYTAHRADLLDAISRAVPAEDVRLGKRCVGLDPAGRGSGGERHLLRFDDGETATADVVIGADGIHSMVRAALTEPAPATYSGLCAFRALVPVDQAPPFARRPAQTLWLGPGHHLVHYPVSAGRLVNLVAFAPAGGYTTESWTATATVEELLAELDGWDGRLTDQIRAAGTPGRPRFCRFRRPGGPAGGRGRGGGAAGGRRYQELRIPRTTRLQEVSHARAHVNHLPDGAEQRARDAAFSGVDPLAASAWIYAFDPEAEPAAG